jgi:hypothetical protein
MQAAVQMALGALSEADDSDKVLTKKRIEGYLNKGLR